MRCYNNMLQKVFDFNGMQVRTVMINSRPYFVGKDICEYFGDTNYRRSLAKLDDDEKGVSPIDTPGGIQTMSIINEAGLYSLLFMMQPQQANLPQKQYEKRLEQVKTFKRWVTHEVIPSIRKTNSYSITIQDSYMIDDPIERAKVWISEEQKRITLSDQIEQQKPKVLFADAVTASNSSVLVGDLAKLIKQNGYDIGAIRLFKWMRDKNFLIKRNGTDYNMPTQTSMDLGLFEIKETSIVHNDGHISINKTPKVTGKGQVYFINKFLEEKAPRRVDSISLTYR